ncbi:MAG: hypothetical protein H6566_00035 [Lewinellaceae bacterium]|nr:hypothetical protein [Lewinellaceae bacterium]
MTIDDYTAIEINNAIYDGKFIKCAKSVLEIFKEVEFKVPIFSESELTLLCELIWSDKEIDELLVELQEFESNVMNNKNSDKNENDYAMYYANMYVGTNSRNARVRRSEILRRYSSIASS